MDLWHTCCRLTRNVDGFVAGMLSINKKCRRVCGISSFVVDMGVPLRCSCSDCLCVRLTLNHCVCGARLTSAQHQLLPLQCKKKTAHRHGSWFVCNIYITEDLSKHGNEYE